MTPTELVVGEKALKAFVNTLLQQEGKSWEAWFIPEVAYVTGSGDVIRAADAAPDQSDKGRHDAGRHALRKALDSSGQGAQVTDQQCADGANAVLKAITASRAGHHH